MGSTRTISAESIPSLGGESLFTEGVSSFETPLSPSPSFRGRRGPSPVRRSLEPVVSPPGEEDEHPLARKYYNAMEPAQQPSPPTTPEDEPLSLLLGQFRPLKYAFRSNLTASFKALRSAAKSFSTINFSSIPSEDLLARSLLTIETNVPYTDERRPPTTEDAPSAEPQTAHSMPPGMRQREMRENSDFIRIAVMEMAMRKRGKLDDQRPGRAKWALPARRTSAAPYEIGANGVPARWRSISY